MSLQLSAQVNGSVSLLFGSGAIPSTARVVGGLSLDEFSRIYAASSGAVAHVLGGVPVDSNGRVLSGSGAISNYVNGLPVSSNGYLAGGGVAITNWSGGLPFDRDGNLVAWNPQVLFAGGQVGFLNTLALDTLFTDTAGTTPVTDIGDTIALGLDQSGNSNDMVQATAAARPVYGRMPVSGVVNLLRRSEDISGSAWTKANTSVSGTLLTRTTTDSNSFVTGTSAFNFAVGEEVTLYVDASLGSVGEEIGFRLQGAYPVRADAVFNLSNGTIRGSSSNTYTGVSASIEALGGGVYRCKLTATIQGSALQLIAFGSATPSASIGGWEAPSGAAGLLDVNVHRVQLQSGASAKDYQKVTAAYDITQPGIPSVPIAYLDTSDDNFSWTLPAGTYHLFIAGDLGCYFDTVTHAGGEFTVGPTSWTGGPAGAITTLIGQRHVIMPVIRDEAFTQSEKELMVAYVMAKGAPGVWEREQLVENGDFAVDADWTKGDGWSIGSGVASCDGSQAAITNLLQNVGFTGTDLVLSEITITRTAGTVSYYIGNTLVGSFSSDQTARRVITRQAAGGANFVVQGNTNYIGTVDNVSADRLTLNTDPLA